MARGLAAIQKNVIRRLRREARETPKGLRNKQIEDVPEDAEFWVAQQEIFFGELSDEVRDILIESILQGETLGLAVNLELANQGVMEFVGGYADEWWGRLESTTRDGLRTAISNNIATGAPLSQLESNLAPLFGRKRAQIIASTETTRLFAEGNRISYRSAGVLEVEFQTVRDSRVDPICDALNGVKLDIESSTVTRTSGVQFPAAQFDIGGPRSNFPPLHPRCRCWLAPVTVEGEVLRDPLGEQYSEAFTNQDVDDLVIRNWPGDPASLYSNSELSALRGFKRSASPVNTLLRTGVGTAATATIANRIAAALLKNLTRDNLVVWRGLDRSLAKAFETDIAAGDGISDASFIVSLLDGEKVFKLKKNAYMKIRVPAGTPSIYMDDPAFATGVKLFGSKLFNESEVLLGKGIPLLVLDIWVEDSSGMRLPNRASDSPLGEGERRIIEVEVIL